MCWMRRRKDGTVVMRLCYLTTNRGMMIELSAEEAEALDGNRGYRCHPSYRRNQSNVSRSSHSKRYTVTLVTDDAPESDIADMARYMDAQYTIDRQRKVTIFYAKHGISDGMIRRAQSFGWQEYQQN